MSRNELSINRIDKLIIYRWLIMSYNAQSMNLDFGDVALLRVSQTASCGLRLRSSFMGGSGGEVFGLAGFLGTVHPQIHIWHEGHETTLIFQCLLGRSQAIHRHQLTLALSIKNDFKR